MAVQAATNVVLFTFSLFQITVTIPAKVDATDRKKATEELVPSMTTTHGFDMSRSLVDRANLLIAGRLPKAAAAAESAAAAA